MVKEIKIFYPSWQNFLMEMPDEDIYLNKLSRKLKHNFSFLSVILKKLIEKGLVTKIPNKRVNNINLTKQGKEVRDCLLKIKEIVGDTYV